MCKTNNGLLTVDCAIPRDDQTPCFFGEYLVVKGPFYVGAQRDKGLIGASGKGERIVKCTCGCSFSDSLTWQQRYTYLEQ